MQLWLKPWLPGEESECRQGLCEEPSPWPGPTPHHVSTPYICVTLHVTCPCHRSVTCHATHPPHTSTLLSTPHVHVIYLCHTHHMPMSHTHITLHATRPHFPTCVAVSLSLSLGGLTSDCSVSLLSTTRFMTLE